MLNDNHFSLCLRVWVCICRVTWQKANGGNCKTLAHTSIFTRLSSVLFFFWPQQCQPRILISFFFCPQVWVSGNGRVCAKKDSKVWAHNWRLLGGKAGAVLSKNFQTNVAHMPNAHTYYTPILIAQKRCWTLTFHVHKQMSFSSVKFWLRNKRFSPTFSHMVCTLFFCILNGLHFFVYQVGWKTIKKLFICTFMENAGISMQILWLN